MNAAGADNDSSASSGAQTVNDPPAASDQAPNAPPVATPSPSPTSRAAHELTCQTPGHVVTPSHTTSVDSTQVSISNSKRTDNLEPDQVATQNRLDGET